MTECSDKLPTSQDLKSLLDHVRGHFQYHAGQRLNTLRYFLVTYAVFVAAYVNVLTARVGDIPTYVKLVVSLMALAVTLIFWGLDTRNQEMVHIDEDAVKEIEGLVSKKYGYEFFNVAARWESKRSIIRYRFIVPSMFVAAAAIALSVVVGNVVQIILEHCAK